MKDFGTRIQDYCISFYLNLSAASENLKRPLVIVFWATWCGPCKIELGRINKMIGAHEIEPSSVLAISSNEDRVTVEKFAREQNYQFQIALDSSGEVARKFDISGTPTVLLVEANRTLAWTTMGISPTLTYRISSFLGGGSP